MTEPVLPSTGGESITIKCEGRASHVAQHFAAGQRLIVTGVERIDHGPAEGVVFLTVAVAAEGDWEQWGSEFDAYLAAAKAASERATQ